nr:beta-ketoacyl synthase chain length factor [Caldovatus aquaticus]
MPGWAASAPVLAGAAPYTPAPVALPPPAALPPTERRRASPAVRLALAAAAEAAAASGLPPAGLETVFASSNGDGRVVGAILEALAAPDGVISPTQFHNSVHNAAAGYWSIAAASQRPSVALGGHDHAFAAGLLHAAARVAATGAPVLLCAYDAPLDEPLAQCRRTEVPFAAALVLAPPGRATPAAAACARLAIAYRAEPAPPSPPAATALDALAAANPAARALPLLRALARREAGRIVLPLLEDGRLEVAVAPC